MNYTNAIYDNAYYVQPVKLFLGDNFLNLYNNVMNISNLIPLLYQTNQNFGDYLTGKPIIFNQPITVSNGTYAAMTPSPGNYLMQINVSKGQLIVDNSTFGTGRHSISFSHQK